MTLLARLPCPFLASRGRGVRDRDREFDLDRGEIVLRGERERDRERDLSLGRADVGVGERVRERPRECDRETMFKDSQELLNIEMDVKQIWSEAQPKREGS